MASMRKYSYVAHIARNYLGGCFFETGMLCRYIHCNNSINCNQERVFFI